MCRVIAAYITVGSRFRCMMRERTKTNIMLHILCDAMRFTFRMGIIVFYSTSCRSLDAWHAVVSAGRDTLVVLDCDVVESLAVRPSRC